MPAFLIRAVVLLGLSCTLISCAPRQAAPPQITADNARYGNTLVHFVEGGRGAPPLVMVHGWGGDHGFWQGQLEPLASSHRVLAVDLPGHGLSGWPDVRYTQPFFADGVVAVMDHASVDRGVLVGHSMGASVVRQVALRHPDRAAGLIIVDGALFDPPKEREALITWQLQMAGFVDNFRGPSGEVFTWEFLDSLHTKETSEEVRTKVRETVLGTSRLVRVSAMEEFVDPAVWRDGPVTVPTLAVYAVSPDLPPDFETTLRGMFSDLEYHVWDGPGHFIMLEKPDALNRLVLDWLERQDLLRTEQP